MAQSEMKGTGPGNKSTSVARRAAAKKCCKKAFARNTIGTHPNGNGGKKNNKGETYV